MRRTSRAVRALVILTLTAVVLPLGGCWVLSLHELATEDDAVFEPALVGVWGEVDDPEGDVFEFIAVEGGTYRILIRKGAEPPADPAQQGVFSARLVRLGDHLFLDSVPETPEGVNEWYEANVVRAHSIGRLSLDGDELHLAFLDHQWLKEKLEAGALALPHEMVNGQIVLTASTAELRAFVVEHAAEAFDEGDALRRVR